MPGNHQPPRELFAGHVILKMFWDILKYLSLERLTAHRLEMYGVVMKLAKTAHLANTVNSFIVLVKYAGLKDGSPLNTASPKAQDVNSVNGTVEKESKAQFGKVGGVSIFKDIS